MEKKNRIQAPIIRNKKRVALKYFDTKEERDEFRKQVRIKEVEEHPEWSDIKKARNIAGMSIMDMSRFLGISYSAAHSMDSNGYNSWMAPYIAEILTNGKIIEPYALEELKEKRKKLGLTQAELAKKLGMLQEVYCSIESGNRKTKALTMKVLTYYLQKIEQGKEKMGMTMTKQYNFTGVSEFWREKYDFTISDIEFERNFEDTGSDAILFSIKTKFGGFKGGLEWVNSDGVERTDSNLSINCDDDLQKLFPDFIVGKRLRIPYDEIYDALDKILDSEGYIEAEDEE